MAVKQLEVRSCIFRPRFSGDQREMVEDDEMKVAVFTNERAADLMGAGNVL